jgi:hypothetical protein
MRKLIMVALATPAAVSAAPEQAKCAVVELHRHGIYW